MGSLAPAYNCLFVFALILSFLFFAFYILYTFIWCFLSSLFLDKGLFYGFYYPWFHLLCSVVSLFFSHLLTIYFLVTLVFPEFPLFLSIYRVTAYLCFCTSPLMRTAGSGVIAFNFTIT